jgi:phospholipid-binding lipoprotein MlaA
MLIAFPSNGPRDLDIVVRHSERFGTSSLGEERALRRSIDSISGRWVPAVACVLVAVVLAGCGTLSRALGDGATPRVIIPSVIDADPPADRERDSDPDDVVTAAASPSDAPDAAALITAQAAPGVEPPVTAQARPPAPKEKAAGAKEGDEYDIEEYDPWESFNEKMFDFNLKLDRHVLKPVAQVYDRVLADELQRMISNAFDNVGAIKRFVNSLLQGKWDGAVREFSRFMVNTTLGVGGLFDVGKTAGIAKSNEDFGQTLGVYGFGPGPYLVLPFLEPMTVRDGIGKGVDGFLDPLSYFLPFFWERLVLKIEDIINDRSLNLELFQGFEETVVDFYSAVRHAYLERRKNLIKE